MTRSDEDRELTATEEWFRDLLGKLLGLGAGAFVVISGWLLSNDTLLSIDHVADAEKREAAIFLCVLLPVAWLAWYVALLKTHSRCPTHPTIMRRVSLHLYCLITGAALFALGLLAVEGLP